MSLRTTSGAVSMPFVMPAIFLLALVLFAPVVYGFWFSLHRIDYGVPTSFVGLANYVKILTQGSLPATLLRSAVFTILTVGLTVTVALALAVLLDRLTGRLGIPLLLLIVLPWVLSSLVATLLFRWVYIDTIGPGSYFLGFLGISDFSPLTSPDGAMSTVILVSVWKRLGYSVVILLAGLRGIPSELKEAASIDGAGAWNLFRFVTLPLMKTPLLLIIIIQTLACLNSTEAALVMTGGGPNDATLILPIDIYKKAFVFFDIGNATTTALVAFVINLVLVVLYMRTARFKI